MSSSVGSVSSFVSCRNEIQTSNSIVKRLLGKMAGLIGRVENLIVEDREVQCKTKADWMSRGEIRSGDLSGSFVGLQ